MRAAIYATVSTEQQGREQTVDSHLEALRRWADEQHHDLPSEHIYIDEGGRGALLPKGPHPETGERGTHGPPVPSPPLSNGSTFTPGPKS